MSFAIETNVPLAPLTTLEVGGPARFYSECVDSEDIVRSLEWAGSRDLPVFVLGGGSNVLISDAGFPGLVMSIKPRPVSSIQRDSNVLVVPAGVNWDELVAFAVEQGLAGLECLSGIPGSVGATPVQNVGAYGQEVAQTIRDVRAVDVVKEEIVLIPAEHCGFAYRTSHFKAQWRGRHIITDVSYRLKTAAMSDICYPDLRRRILEAKRSPASGKDVRRTVIDIRREKSMVIDADDPNHRSAGSFFVNPIIPAEQLDDVRQAVSRYQVSDRTMPQFSVNGGVKIPAAWLIEEAGFTRGFRRGRAAISTNHTLAIVNLGGATAVELIGLASLIRKTVRDRFGICLSAEPEFVGFEKSVDALMD